MFSKLWNWLFPRAAEITAERKRRENTIIMTPAEWAEDFDRRHAAEEWEVEK